MAPLCGICHQADPKYKCPVCELRYCSIICYKPHKNQHEAENSKQQLSDEPKHVKLDRPGTTQRTPKVDFSTFEHDAEFQRLLQRFPLLKTQLQVVYALTIDPGPDEQRTWSRQPLPSLESTPYRSRRARGGMRGTFRGRGGFVRGSRDVRRDFDEDRQGGQWTKEKGDKEAVAVLQRMSDEKIQDDRAEGMREFIELVRMRFGDHKGDET